MAVVRLISSSNFVGNSIGRSPGSPKTLTQVIAGIEEACGQRNNLDRSDQAKSQGLFDHLAVSRQLELEHGTFRYVR